MLMPPRFSFSFILSGSGPARQISEFFFRSGAFPGT